MRLFNRLSNNIFLIILILLTIVSFSQFFAKGLLPIPSDTIIGLYHPYRDLYAHQYPNGIPFKNFLITDPVRQTYPWKNLSIDIINGLSLPLWNPYLGTGTPLLANFQSGVFYPLNVILFMGNFSLAWSYFIFLQPVLAGLFFYFYLKNLRIDDRAVLLGAVSFCFSGFFVSWLEWGNIVHTGLWLPLILLCIDKIYYYFYHKESFQLGFKIQKYLTWSIIFTFSLISSFFAGHIQIFFYVLIFSSMYFFARWIQFGMKKQVLFLFIILNSLFLIFTSIQWIPTLQFISLSARSVDQSDWLRPGWFIPWQNLIQLAVPDFFGNPATLNYWGVWNYAELVGYAGLLPLLFAVFAVAIRHDKKTVFYLCAVFLSLLFSLPTPVSKIAYILNIPFIATSQPTRLLFITCFSVAVLSALGLDYFLKNLDRKKTIRKLSAVIFGFSLLFIIIWAFVIYGNSYLQWILPQNLVVAQRNLIFPSLIFGLGSLNIFLFILLNKRYRSFLALFLLLLTSIDLLRFESKFEPFTKQEYLFPQTQIIKFLKNQKQPFRIMSTDSRIFPPNFSSYYKIESIENYDPLYLLSYAQFIAASERGGPNIEPPYGFNRIIAPHNIDSKLIDMLNVKYVFSLSDIKSLKFKKVFSEGETRVYENLNFIPRAYFVNNLYILNTAKDSVEKMFENSFDLRNDAVLSSDDTALNIPKDLDTGEVEIVSYSENRIIIKTQNSKDGFLVLTNSYYPTWHAQIINYDSNKKINPIILRTDLNFQGIVVPKGKNMIEFYISIF